MNKFLMGALGTIIGALVLKGAHAKGRKEAYKEINDKLDFIVKVNELNKKKDGES
jgi:hypothetical protein